MTIFVISFKEPDEDFKNAEENFPSNGDTDIKIHTDILKGTSDTR